MGALFPISGQIESTIMHSMQRNWLAPHPPIVIIGMHRSGTSMVTRMLESLGLFVGAKKDSNCEAKFFQRINRWLLDQTGSSWDNPQPIHYLLNNREVRAKTSDYIARFLLKSPRAVSFLGWRNYLRHRDVRKLDAPWGWKDPRNTFTLPLWLDVFPGAKIVHVRRYGVDVAHSLQRRGRLETSSKNIYRDFPIFHWVREKRGGFVHSLRCDSLQGGFSLWEEYLQEATSHVTMLNERALEVRFEDVISEPVRSLERLCRFSGLTASLPDIQRVAGLIRKDRAYAFRANPQLESFPARVAERAQASTKA